MVEVMGVLYAGQEQHNEPKQPLEEESFVTLLESLGADFLDLCLIAASYLLPTLLSFLISEVWIFQSYGVNRKSVRFLFCVTFGLSLNMLLLVIFEILSKKRKILLR